MERALRLLQPSCPKNHVCPGRASILTQAGSRLRLRLPVVLVNDRTIQRLHFVERLQPAWLLLLYLLLCQFLLLLFFPLHFLLAFLK